MPGHQVPEPEHGRKQMVSYFLGLIVQLSSAPAKYEMKCLPSHRVSRMQQTGVATAAARPVQEKAEDTQAQGLFHSGRSPSLFIHLTDEAEWFASQMLRKAVEIQSQQKKRNSQANSEVARWTVSSQVIKSVTQCHMKQQACANREDPPGRLADRHAEHNTATQEEAEQREARKRGSPPNPTGLACISVPPVG